MVWWTAMDSLLLTRPGDRHPFTEAVKVSWDDDVFTFQLVRWGGVLVAADRCRVPNALAVLDALLSQLAGDGLPGGPAAIAPGRAWPMPVRHRGLFPRR